MENIEKILIFLLSNAIQLGIMALVIVLSIVHRRQIKTAWRTGLLIAVTTAFLGLPLQILLFKNMDFEQIAGPFIRNYSMWQRVEPFVYVIAAIVGVVMIIYSAVYLFFCYAGAFGEWNRISPESFPVLQYKTSSRAQKGKLGIPAAISAGTAIVLAILSYLLMNYLNVGTSREMESLFNNFPGLFLEPMWIQGTVFLLFVISAAITEEIMFRGVLLGFFMRITKNNIIWYIAASVIVSAAWAFLHYYNTNAPLIKLGQVFVLGLFLAEMCRRWSLETAIVFHVVFNAASISIELLFPL